MESEEELRDQLRKIEKQMLKRTVREGADTVNLHRWRNHPEIWLEERFGEDSRSIIWTEWDEKIYADHEWDATPNPFWTAWKSVAKNRHTAIKSATGTGKTYTFARIVYWWLDCWENSKVFTSAPKEQQLELQLWAEMSQCFYKFKRIRPFAEMSYLKLRVHAKDKRFSESWMAEGFVAGVRASEESTTKAQGLHGDRMLIITEETPGMPWPTMNAFINTSTGDNNRILAAGNPDNVTDPLALYIDKNKKVQVIQVSGYDHPNIVLGKTVIQGAVSQMSIDERIDTYGEDSWFFKSRIRGITPEQSKDSLIKYDWIMSCIPKSRHWSGPIPADFSYNSCALDVANSDTGDMGAAAFGRRNHLLYLNEFRCPNATHLAYNIIYSPLELSERKYQDYGLPKITDYEIEHELIGVDPVGIGAATVNAFKDLGYDVQSIQGGQDDSLIPSDAEGKPMYRFSSRRAQVYYLLAQDLLHRRIIIDIGKENSKLLDQLIVELVVIKMKIQGGVISIDSKEDIKKKLGGKSPNLGDVFAYWNYSRRGTNKTGYGMMPMI